MLAREITCKVLSVVWLSPSVFSLRFYPSKKIAFHPGQFLSVQIPDPEKTRRIYSFASSEDGEYELCVQRIEGGIGSNYLASLQPGDEFRASAPYGDFVYNTKPSRNACFIATGTGIAPFKSMILSRSFKKNHPEAAVLLFGARDEKEILYPGLFEQHSIEVVHALSNPSHKWKGFRGRVTDFLRSLPQEWAWSETDFYLCGNGYMIQEVYQFLVQSRGVSPRAIRKEAYFSTHAVPASKPEAKAAEAA